MIKSGMEKSRLLVTGANGLLGKALLDYFASSHQVTALVRVTPQKKNPLVEYVEIDLSRDWSIASLPRHIDAIVHVAQSNRYRDFPNSAAEVFEVNLVSTFKMLEYAREIGVRKFIYTSSGGIYSQSGSPLNENSEINSPDKLNFYLATKLSSEVFSMSYKEFFDLDILRVFFMFGPGQKPNMLLPRLIHSVKEGTPIQLAGESGIRINPIYVNDVVRLIENRLATSDSKVINVAGLEIVSIKQLSELIAGQIGKNPNYEYLPPQPDLIADTTLCTELFKGQTTSLADGLTRMISSTSVF